MSRTGTHAPRLAGLDGLRAVAAITVLSYHVAEWSRFAFAGRLAPLMWELKGGVAIFFVISGAVLYVPYARAIRDRETLPDWRRYARRRAVRILPAYWIALTVVAIGPFSAGVLGHDLWSYYGLSQIYSPDTSLSGLGGAWSLCVEVSFYALLPLFARLAARLARRADPRAALRAQLALIGLCGLASIALRGALAGSLTASIHDHGVTLMTALPGFLDWFAIGMGLAVLAAEWEAGRARGGLVGALARRPGWCAVLALIAFGWGVHAQGGDMFLPWYGLDTHLALGAGSGLLVLAAIAPQSARGPAIWLRLLRGRYLTWIGTISYGIYLWNRVGLQLLSRQPEARTLSSTILIWVAVLAWALLLGAASWYLIERPAQRVLRARERRSPVPSRVGHTPESEGVVQSVADGLNPAGVAVDHLA
jgi:peptidoglycan/LPS O-acetylase OafA/YrhL